MKTALRITTLGSLALLFCSNTVLAATEGGAASHPGPEAMFLFGVVLVGMISVNRHRFMK